MVNRDYTKEVGLDSGDKIIPWPLAAAVFALVAAGGWFTVGEVRAAAKKEQALKLAARSAQAAKTAGPALASK